MLAKVPAVVAPEHDDRIVIQTEGFDFVEDAPDLGVHETDAGGITVFQVPSIGGIFQPCLRMMAILLHQLKARVIRRRIRHRPPFGLRDLFRIIEVEVFLRRPERQMGFYKSNRKEEWFAFQCSQGFDDGIRHGAVKIGGVRQIKPASGMSLFFAGVILKIRMFGVTIQDSAPTAGQGVLFSMADLADGESLIPGLFEEVRKGLDSPFRGELEIHFEGEVACFIVVSRTASGQQGVPGGTAGRSRYIVMGKKPGRFGERINTR